MGYAIQNLETGELDYVHLDLNTVQHQIIDDETGEPLNGGCKVKVRYAKHQNFHIPKKYLRGTICEEFEKKMTSLYEGDYVQNEIQVMPVVAKKEKPKKKHYEKEDFINMEGVKKEIILGYNKQNIHIFLIPTMFFFNMYVGLFLAVLEAVLHFSAHKKNGLNMNKNYYYRSPLHILSSQFCARCRSENEMGIQIFKTLNKQMRTARASRTLKDVTKAIS